MAILRSRAVQAEAVTVANPAVDQALGIWRERVEQAREEGRELGRQEAGETLAEAQRVREEAEERVRAAEAAAEERVAAERARVVEELGLVMTSLHELIGDHERLRAEVLRAAEREVVELACALAARVLRHEVHHDPAWLEDLLARALAMAPDKRRVLLRLHPADAELLAEQLPAVEQGAGLAGAVELRADEHLSRGACLIESGGTSIDAGIAGSWGRLREQLLLAAPADRWQVGARAEVAAATARVDEALAEQGPAGASAATEPAPEPTPEPTAESESESESEPGVDDGEEAR